MTSDTDSSDAEWEEVGSNGMRCPQCEEVVHEQNVFSHLRSEHMQNWAAITLDERTVGEEMEVDDDE